MNVLKEGGNAVDAAIAVSYALGVVEPYGSGIGGGGGMLVAKEGEEPTFIDYREVAPSSLRGKTGVPGFVAGMEYVSKKYGTTSMTKLIEPAIEYAEEGFKVDDLLASRLYYASGRMDTGNLPNFFPKGEAIKAGEGLKQPELAEQLTYIKQNGAAGFYQKDIAKRLEEETNITLEDLQNYEVEERQPVISTYKGNEIIAAPPPFSGITVIQMLKMMEKENVNIDEQDVDYGAIKKIKEIAYAARVKEVSDPAFYPQDVERFLSNEYIESLLENSEERAVESSDQEHESTTHFVVIDKEGTTVSTTNTLSNFFGLGKQVDGFFLNNNADTYGSIGVNNPEPGKRARTFTAPLIIRKEGEWIMGVGTPGGTRIPQVLNQVLARHFQGGEELEKAVETPRFIFDQETLYIEPTTPEEVIERMSAFDVQSKTSDVYYGGVQLLMQDFDSGKVTGVGDSRRNGVWKHS
ncbi:capsular biosynthesis protein [Bacillus sp. CBEL-1]|nr:capsular biosynthesis protein [Bacillus sp. CBEL-1]